MCTIGWCAFQYCNLSTINLPQSLKTIDSDAFSYNDLVGEIIIPDNVTDVNSNAFRENKKLTGIYLGRSVKKFELTAIDNCPNICNITVSDDNEYFSSYSGVLYDKSAIKMICIPSAIEGGIIIPKTVEQFTAASVDDCEKLTAIYVEEGNAKYKSIDGILYSADGKILVRCPVGRIGAVILTEGTEQIGAQAFLDSKIDSIIFPTTLKEIGLQSFYHCYKIKKLSFNEGLETIGRQAFNYCNHLTEVSFPSTLKSIGYSAFASCNIIGELILPDSLNSIGTRAFSYNEIEKVYFGSGLSNVSKDAFKSNTWRQFKYIEVSDANPYYSSKDGILYNDTLTEIIIIPDGMSGEISIANTIEKFDSTLVNYHEKITGFNVEEGGKYITSEDGILYSADKKTLIRCPEGKQGDIYVVDGVETIGERAFYNCTAISKIHLPESLKKISSMSIYQCSVTEINLPRNLSVVEEDGLFGCENLTTINIPPEILNTRNESLLRNEFTYITLPETVQTFDHLYSKKLELLVIENRYCQYTSLDAPVVSDNCLVKAYCGSPGHDLAIKQLLSFESIGHTYLDWYIYQPASFEQDGVERRDCAYCDGYDERIIPKLEKDVFTATFVASGKVIATVDFPKGTTEIAEPKVPAKDRYVGEWEAYTLEDADITINAVYTLIKSDDASDVETESEAIHYTDKDDVLFRFKTTADALVVKSTVSKSVPLDIVLVVDQSGSMDETLGGSVKKVDALKDTAKDFVNTVFENAKMTSADHRISLVGFGLSGTYQGFEKNENTELLTSANGIVKFDNIKTTDYASSLLSVNVDGEVNDKLIEAIDSIAARGATAADLGFEMAKGVFANTDSAERQRVVIFMTDGVPTYSSSFQTSVANSAIANAFVLKKNFDASIYSVGVFSDADSKNTNINKFMNAVSSGYPDAASMSYMGKGVDGQYYITVNNTDSLTSVFKTISTESLSHTAPFDNLTIIKTLSEYVTLTSKQEEQLRMDLIRKHGITNDDIIISRNDDGTTTVQINSLSPYEVTDENGNITYEVAVEFFASLNEKASTAGDYIVDTEDSGIMLGEDAMGYEATFDTSKITLDSAKTRIIFTINGEVYEVSEGLSNGYAVAPDFEIADDWQFSGWNTTSQKATNGLTIDATLIKANRTIIWHTADGDIEQTYVAGDFIVVPEVFANANGDVFLSWDKSIPTTMPDENLEFVAVYGGHIHNYTSEVTKEMTCTADGVRTFTCSCGDIYDETITAIGHNYEAITPSLDKEDAKCTFCCTNCGNKYDYALDYEVVEATGKKTKVLYEFNLTDDNLNTEFQPDGSIKIKIPLTEIHGNTAKATVIRTNDDGTKTEVPAVIEDGFLVITCDHFTPYEVIFDIPCARHIQGEWVVTKVASCTEEGFRYALCTECEKQVFEEVIEKLDHEESEWIIGENATCTKEGLKHTECKNCKEEIKSVSIPKENHSYAYVVTPATCTDDGYTTYTCSVCGDNYKSNETSKLGHDMSAYVVTKHPTCTENGIEKSTCSRCSRYETKTISAKGHSYEEAVCKACGDNKADDCSHMCHKNNFIWKFVRFFWKLFKMNPVCECGVKHY